MKKTIVLSLFILLLTVSMFAGTARSYYQKVVQEAPAEILDIVTAPVTPTSHCAAYTMQAWMLSRPGEVLSTATNPVTTIRIAKTGNGTTVPYYAVAYVQLGSFATQWVAADVMHIVVTHIATGQVASWDFTIPAGTATINLTNPAQVIPPVPTPAYVAPYAPTAGLPTGTVGWTGQSISWTASATDATHRAAASYNVYYGIGAYGAANSVTVGTTFPVTLVANSTYMAKVEAVNADGTSTPLTWTFTTRTETNPNAATLVAPLDTAELITVWPAVTLNATLEWAAPAAGVTPTGYKISWNGGALEDLGNVLTVTKNALIAGAYTWQVVPYYTDGGAKSVKLGTPVATRATTNSTRGDAVGCPVWSFDVLVGTPPNRNFEVTSDPTGTPIYVGGVNSTFVTPHTFAMAHGSSALYTVVDAAYTWAPVSYQVTNIVANGSVNFVGTLVPPTQYTVNITSGNIQGATIWLNGVATADVTPHVYTLDAGTLDLHYAVQKENYDWVTNPLFDAEYIPTLDGNKNIDFVGTFHVANVPADMDFLGEPNVPITGVVGNTTVYTTPIAPGLGAIVMTFSGTTTSDLFVVVPAGTWFAVAYYSGAWHTGTLFPTVGPGTITFFNVPFGAKAPVPVIVDPSGDPTLPVELSSFTAVLTAEYFVNLTWVTESETQVLGFNVYRSETNDVATAVRVNASAIGATNTSEQHTYTMTDREVETNATYYYWLENVDMGGGNAMHGPQMVTVTGNPTPVLPEISMLNSAYPNPFRSGANTNINVSIKAGETGTVTVYNILGQTVKTFKVNEGTHTLRWDGKNCGSGIYFYKLTTPTTNATKKLVIVK